MNRRVLFVDDDALLRTIYRRQTQGIFDVEIVESAEQALAAIEAGDFAVIVSDLAMPGMDGLALAHRARQIAPRAILIILSARADWQFGAPPEGLLFCVLDKPCPRDRLLATLEEAIAIANTTVVSTAAAHD
ncbi:MAG TPA: response regulator [Pirellulales bacterium]|jgi:CheY-like chemotaxis protein|nr:response regulator [Pirellulales bacterium]